MFNINNPIGKMRFLLLDLLGEVHINKVLNDMRVQQYYSKDALHDLMQKKISHLFNIATSSTAYYKNAISYDHLDVLTKQKVRDHFEDFISNTYSKKLFLKSTSGSTGMPLSYLATSDARSNLWAGIILSWEVMGYKLGDKVAFIAGSGLLNVKSNFRHAIFYKILNVDTYSAFSLNDNDILKYIQSLNKRKTKIIYGYASALDKMATFINRFGPFYFDDLKGIVCTSEMLTPAMRENIKSAFHVDVFNQYGCNEAGVSAFECEHHHLHLISTRCYYEVDEVGNLISTDLSNEGFPMIKYLTGDIVELSDDATCSCGRNFPILKNILGRAGDVIIDVTKKTIHCAFFQILFRNEKSIKQFQISFDNNNINIFLNVDGSIKDNAYYNKFLNEIKKHLTFDSYNMYFNSPFLTSENAKHRHVINLAV